MTEDFAAELERVWRIFEDGFRPPPHPEVKKRPPSRRRRHDCVDCGVDCSFATGNGHFYTVRDDVWAATGLAPNGGKLCFECLEARLGRLLTSDDLIATPFEIMSRMHGKDEIAEASLRKRGRDDLTDKAAAARRKDEEWRAEQERHWQEVRARHPEWKD